MKTKMYDVVVCGAGIAGIAAAIAAARQGKNTALIEKQCLLGGLATSGLIYIYLPLCDGYGNQIIRGLAEELLRRSVEYGPFDVPEKWGGPAGGNPGINGDRYQCCFSPAGFTLTLDKMLAEAGVDLWLDSMVIDAQTEDQYLRSVTVANASGQVKVEGKCFIDATGGAFIVEMAGGKVFRHENYISPWVMECSEDSSHFHFTDSLHIGGAGAITKEFLYPDCNSGKLVSDFVRKSWELIRDKYDKLTSEQRKKNYPVHLAAMPQFRKIGRIDALQTIDGEDHGKCFDDSVGLVSDWRRPAPPWDTPYGCLIPKDVKGILAAGRCIGASGEAWEVYRVIPTAAMTGEIAGLAAALSANENITPDQLDYQKLKTILTVNKGSQK